jgi:hypothetical protein
VLCSGDNPIDAKQKKKVLHNFLCSEYSLAHPGLQISKKNDDIACALSE